MHQHTHVYYLTHALFFGFHLKLEAAASEQGMVVCKDLLTHAFSNACSVSLAFFWNLQLPAIEDGMVVCKDLLTQLLLNAHSVSLAFSWRLQLPAIEHGMVVYKPCSHMHYQTHTLFMWPSIATCSFQKVRTAWSHTRKCCPAPCNTCWTWWRMRLSWMESCRARTICKGFSCHISRWGIYLFC